ncbi:MAG: diphthamide biosynthesis enzyme Dph2 [Thermoplasmatales archaeon]|nr:MAG: diphthamide biosynthesis enzyme Dph2 [Thermoplasmatales archaeon]
MKIPGYEIDLEKAVKIIKNKKYERVLLQITEGLKIHISKFIEFLEEETSASVIISADQCFGACDVVSSELKDMKIDFVIQIGHTQLPNIEDYLIPTLFINAKSDIDISIVIKKAVHVIKGKKIGLITTSQHIDSLKHAIKILKDNNFEPIIGKSSSRVESDGQILGCDFSAARSISKQVDTFLYIGSGNFHPLGLALSTNNPVIVCDPYTNQVKVDELIDIKDMILRQRYGAIARSKDAKIFGILIGTKKGQQRIELALKIKDKLNSKKKKSILLIQNHFTASILESFRDIDCFVSTACPRIAIDDYMQYKVPIITPIELDILLGIKKWEDYQFDEILI